MRIVKSSAAEGEWFKYETQDSTPEDTAEFKIRRIPSEARKRVVKGRFHEKEKVTIRKGAVELDRESERVRLADIDLAAFALVDARTATVPASIVGQGGNEDFVLDGRLSDEIKRCLLDELPDLRAFVLEMSDSLEAKRLQKEAELGEA